MSVYYLIASSELQQRHISLSTTPMEKKEDLYFRDIDGTTFYAVEVDEEHIVHDAFVDYSPCTAEDIQSIAAPEVKSVKADFIGPIHKVQSTDGPIEHDYDITSPRYIEKIAFEALSFRGGDKLSVKVKMPDGEGGWTVINEPVTGWLIQTGVYKVSFPKSLMADGLRISFTYDKMAGSPDAEFTINFEQYKE